ncbi:hypothetical protein, partial [uncultured Nostoc sp.]|uniref:hypothetical protein n=1 Tax=uncultured Nostoc sp. TaxID=340711 RepID=UPI0035C9E6A1
RSQLLSKRSQLLSKRSQLLSKQSQLLRKRSQLKQATRTGILRRTSPLLPKLSISRIFLNVESKGIS